MTAPQPEPIAITGMACRFPGAPSLDAFWAALREGLDAVSAVPSQRWNARGYFDADSKARGKTNTLSGGFIEHVDRFDAAFFGISRREATQMDPQQRILLELTYEALEDAGIAPTAIAGSDAAVFVGAMTNDYLRLQLGDSYRRIDVHTGSGAGLCMLANRLSYQFDLRGPSAAVDTACSSSLVAVFQACQALWTRQSHLAVAAGVNVMLDPAFHVFYAKAGLSAPDGRCKTFSAAANGIGRAEGAGVVVLKRLQDALADGDPLYAVIRGGAVNHDGRSNGLTQPNRWAQEQLLRRAFDHAAIDRQALQYIELHGTGTLIGDPIEANALAAVLTEQGAREEVCLVGSVKTNVGHLEAAAGIAGLIKLALSIAHGEVPPSLWFDAPNPHIPFERMPIRVNTGLTPWSLRDGQRTGGISSFGLGGTNAHLVLQSAPCVAATAVPAVSEHWPQHWPKHWLFLSARSPAALQAAARAYIEFLPAMTAADLPRVCSTALGRKGIHDCRLSVFGSDATELVGALQAFVAGIEHPALLHGRYRPAFRRLILALARHTCVQPPQLYKWIASNPRACAAWNACRDALRATDDCTHVNLPEVQSLGQHAEVGLANAEFPMWSFAAQYCLVKAISTALPVERLTADGIGQLAVMCATGKLALQDALQWLATHDSPLAIHPSSNLNCDSAAGVDSSPRETLCGAADQPWQARSGQQLDAGDLDVVVLAPCVTDEPGIALPSAASIHSLDDAPGGLNHLLAKLALLHPFKAAAAAADYGFIRLPAYAWQRESYWLARDAEQPAEALHELLGQQCGRSPMAWENHLGSARLPYLQDHRVQGMTVLPGSGYVELGLAVHRCITGQPCAVLQDLVFGNVLVLPEGQDPRLQVVYDDATRTFSIHTRQRDTEELELHARGSLSLSVPAAQPAVDLEAIRSRCTRHSDSEAHYQNMLARGFQYGPYFQGVRGLWSDEAGEESLAWIAGHEQLAVTEHGNRLHPTLFDAALQSLLTLLQVRGDDELYIPTGIRELRLYRAAGHGFWCTGRLKNVAPGVIEGAATLFDEHGEVIAQAEGVRAQALTKRNRDELQRSDEWLYQYEWENAPRESSNRPNGSWLLLADQGGVAGRLGKELCEAGAAEPILVPSESQAELSQVLQGLPDDITGIAYLWALDAPEDASALAGGTTHMAKPVRLLQAMHARYGAELPELVIVTRSVQNAAAEGTASIAQSPLVGLVRVAINEYPGMRVRAIDIDDDPATLPQLAAEMLSSSNEDEVALRGTQRFVHRMKRQSAAQLVSQSACGAAFDHQGTYLITGGLGGFGFAIAQWLAVQGARHLVLVSRSGGDSEQAQQAIAKLTAAGAAVLAVAADVANEAEVATLIRRIRTELPPLKGVFHAAAVLDDAPIALIEPRQIDNAMGAKAQGAWHLHCQTLDAPLDYFVLFSSIASMVGGSGQVSYAMACSYLDALARFRRARGLPASSINWGALAEIGMATRHADAQRHLGRSGVGSFTPSQAVAMFARTLQWNPVELGVAMMDWNLWGAIYPGWRASPKYGGLLSSQAAAAAASDSTLLGKLGQLAPAQREAEIGSVLVQLLAKTLESAPEEVEADASLIALGIDSLMALDLQAAIEKHFAVKISTLELMKGSTPATLAKLVMQRVAGGEPAAAIQPAPVELERLRQRMSLGDVDIEAAEKIIAQLDGLGEEELDGLLSALAEEEVAQ